LTAFIREKSDDNRELDSKIPQDIQAALTVIESFKQVMLTSSCVTNEYYH
jgi:hypothetical protein